MKPTLVAIVWAVAISLNNGAAAQEVATRYLGSFTHQRTSESGHVYIYEFRLWQTGAALHGALLSVAGLEGGGVPPMVEAITEGSMSASGEMAVRTKSFSFSGRYEENSLAGELKQGSENIWGGEEGSNEILLRRGTSIPSISEPQLSGVEKVQSWVNKLK